MMRIVIVSRSALVENAVGRSVTEKKITDDLLDVTEDTEQIHFIFNIKSGIDSDGVPRTRISNHKADAMVSISDYRILFIEEDKYCTRIEQIPLSSIEKIEIDEPGIIRSGSLRVKSKDHHYTAKLHRSTVKSDLSNVREFIKEHRQSCPGHLSETSTGLDGFGSIRVHALIRKITIVESYGLNINNDKRDTGEYWLQIHPDELRLFTQEMTGDIQEATAISTERLDFDNISTSSERDFSKENLNRYTNQINPFLDDASPAKKRSVDMVTLPLDEGNKHIIIEFSKDKSMKTMMSGLSELDPRLDDNNQPTSSKRRREESGGERSPIDTLKHRLAQGEISPEEFEKMKEHLQD